MTMEERKQALLDAMLSCGCNAVEADVDFLLKRAFPELTGPNPTHVIVPMEPTGKMVAAAIDRLKDGGDSLYTAIYKSMLAAAD